MQSHEDNHESLDPIDQVPPALVDALTRANIAIAPFIPRAVDQAILSAARRHLGPAVCRRNAWFQTLRWAGGFAAAAALALLAIAILEKAPSRSSTLSFARGDVNHDGKVDILDAFIVAKRIQSGAPLSLDLDLNGDGRVDAADVALLSAQIVRLTREVRTSARPAEQNRPRPEFSAQIPSSEKFLAVLAPNRS